MLEKEKREKEQAPHREETQGTARGKTEDGEAKASRRGLQDQVYLAAIRHFRASPEAEGNGLVMAALAFGGYHLVGWGLRRLAEVAPQNPLLGAIEALSLLANPRQPKVPLNPELSRRLGRVLAQKAEEMVRAGGDMRTATRLMALDPRMALLFLKGTEALSEREAYALALLLVGEGRRAVSRLEGLPVFGTGRGREEGPRGEKAQ